METTKEKILEAAKVSEEAKDVLEKLFPEAFEENKFFNLNELLQGKHQIFSDDNSKKAGFISSGFIEIRENGEYRNKAFYLSDEYNWEMKYDDEKMLCLIPTRKNKNLEDYSEKPRDNSWSNSWDRDE